MKTKRGIMRHSLLVKLGVTLALIVGLAIIGMTTSEVIAERIQGSGEAINVAGSLRMQAYQMTSLALSANLGESEKAVGQLRTAIDTFDRTLSDPRITKVLPKHGANKLISSYRAVQADWEAHMKPRFMAAVRAQSQSSVAGLEAITLSEVTAFVGDINYLVKQIELGTETNVLILRVVLWSALIMTLLVGAFTLYLARKALVLPLRGLLDFASNVGRGNLAVRTEYTGKDELGRLGQAFNRMANDLSTLYQNLEAKVEEKTAELTVANRSLELLYHSIARVYNGPLAPHTYSVLLKDLENVLDVGHGVACLVEADEGRARTIASTVETASGGIDPCEVMSCGECLAHKTLTVHTLKNGKRVVSLPLRDTERNYGVLQLEMSQGRELEPWQIQLLEALSRHIGIAISMARRIEQSRRLSLLEERAAIARELHDSLAQSLAYMKIQVSRLKPLLDKSSDSNGAIRVLDELREGLNSAYRQLRELLSTFRARIGGGGLTAALQPTVAEFSRRGGIPIALEVDLSGCSLTPNEEIHTMQIVREALSNVLNHAQATRASVKVTRMEDGAVSAIVEDDGVGILEMAGPHHYGLTIMEERAQSMGGTLRIDSPSTTGARVTLRFVPTGRSIAPTSIQQNI